MNENKFKRLVAAATATGVILLVVLISVMIFQLIAINMENAKKKELDAAIAHYEQLIEKGGDLIEIRQTRWWIEQRARELGYRYEDDVDLG
mgnify:CR=1 FL=1